MQRLSEISNEKLFGCNNQALEMKRREKLRRRSAEWAIVRFSLGGLVHHRDHQTDKTIHPACSLALAPMLLQLGLSDTLFA
jgi:hypothetical protein